MINESLSTFSDQELLAEEKKMRSFSITNALFIGSLTGIIMYSIAASSWGFLTLIPLYFIYRMLNDHKNKRRKELEVQLHLRKLK